MKSLLNSAARAAALQPFLPRCPGKRLHRHAGFQAERLVCVPQSVPADARLIEAPTVATKALVTLSGAKAPPSSSVNTRHVSRHISLLWIFSSGCALRQRLRMATVSASRLTKRPRPVFGEETIAAPGLPATIAPTGVTLAQVRVAHQRGRGHEDNHRDSRPVHRLPGLAGHGVGVRRLEYADGDTDQHMYSIADADQDVYSVAVAVTDVHSIAVAVTACTPSPSPSPTCTPSPSPSPSPARRRRSRRRRL